MSQYAPDDWPQRLLSGATGETDPDEILPMHQDDWDGMVTAYRAIQEQRARDPNNDLPDILDGRDAKFK